MLYPDRPYDPKDSNYDFDDRRYIDRIYIEESLLNSCMLLPIAFFK